MVPSLSSCLMLVTIAVCVSAQQFSLPNHPDFINEVAGLANKDDGFEAWRLYNKKDYKDQKVSAHPVPSLAPIPFRCPPSPPTHHPLTPPTPNSTPKTHEPGGSNGLKRPDATTLTPPPPG